MDNHLVRKNIMPQPGNKEKAAGAIRESLRAELKKARGLLTPEEYLAKSAAAQEKLCAHELFKRADSVALYMPIKGEIGTGLVFARALEAGKTVYMPRILHARRMEFAQTNSMSDLESGPFGLRQPVAAIRGFGPDEFGPGLMVMPGIAFDLAGRRLGFGGGYYDRFLGARKNVFPVAGLCFAFQLVDEIPAMPWDYGVDTIFTENGSHAARLIK